MSKLVAVHRTEYNQSRFQTSLPVWSWSDTDLNLSLPAISTSSRWLALIDHCKDVEQSSDDKGLMQLQRTSSFESCTFVSLVSSFAFSSWDWSTDGARKDGQIRALTRKLIGFLNMKITYRILGECLCIYCHDGSGRLRRPSFKICRDCGY